MSGKADKKLIEQLKNGSLFKDKPDNVDPTKENKKDLQKGGGGK